MKWSCVNIDLRPQNHIFLIRKNTKFFTRNENWEILVTHSWLLIIGSDFGYGSYFRSKIINKHGIFTHNPMYIWTKKYRWEKVTQWLRVKCQNWKPKCVKIFPRGHGQRQNRRYSVGAHTPKICTNPTILVVLLLNIMALIMCLAVHVCLSFNYIFFDNFEACNLGIF